VTTGGHVSKLSVPTSNIPALLHPQVDDESNSCHISIGDGDADDEAADKS